MLKLFRTLMPKEDKFFLLFERHAGTVVDGAKALVALLEGGSNVLPCCRRIAEHEEAADVVAREVLLAVRRTFITPFDRSDIQALTTSLDDAIDQMQKTAKAITLFEVDSFRPAMQEMGGIIMQAAETTADAVPLLRSIGSNADRLHRHTETIIQLEDRADDTFDSGMKALFRETRDRPMDYIVNAEIYDHLESVMDRFEDVANQINSILVEHL